MIPANVNPLLMAGNADPLDEYRVIKNSVRFNSPDGPFFYRTVAAGADRKKGAISIWIKPTKIVSPIISDNGNMHLFHAHNGNDIAGTGVTAYSRLVLVGDGTNALNRLQWQSSAGAGEAFTSNALYRDLSAHGHLYVRWDTTIPMFEAYWNGQEISYASRTLPTLNADTMMGLVSSFMMMGTYTSAARFFDGYLSMPHVILGSAPPVTYFGAVHPKTGQWRPKPYQGTFGAHDSYMDFSDGSAATAAALGADRSGNGNNWTPTNISVAAGVDQDWMIDTPTNNFATLNSLARRLVGSAVATFSDGNLKAVGNSASAAAWCVSTIGFVGKTYHEFTVVIATPAQDSIGVATELSLHNDTLAGVSYNSDGSTPSGAAAWVGGDVLGMAVDGVAKTVQYYRNNVAQGAAQALTGNEFFTILSVTYWSATSTGAAIHANFGQRPFIYTPPTGFVALCTKNLPIKQTIMLPRKYFNPILYTGNGASRSLTGLGFSPDLVIAKDRSAARAWGWWDKVRGATKYVESSSSIAEVTDAANGLTSFDVDGFSLAAGLIWNASAETFVAYGFLEGSTPGFDIVTYTGNGANRTVTHGLGVAPAMVIVKSRTAAQNWPVYHKNQNSSPASGALFLSTLDAFATDSSIWNNTAPTSAVFSLGTNASSACNNTNLVDYVAYLFAEVPGFSKFGSYVGNGLVDGPFAHCGFRPAFVMVKLVSAGSSWRAIDSTRSPSNVVAATIHPNLADAEVTTVGHQVDILSNGFKLRSTDPGFNGSGYTYVFMAFAEFPFRYANAR